MPVKPTDEQSSAIIHELIDAAEDWLEARGCPPAEASARVTVDYIYRTAGITNGASWYMPSDEYIGASIFLSYLPGARTKLRSTARERRCAKMLSEQPYRFFPDYGVILRHLFNLELRRTNTKSLYLNGIILLAAASLRGAKEQIRREERRRGGMSKMTLVSYADMDRRMLPDYDLDSVLFYGPTIIKSSSA